MIYIQTTIASYKEDQTVSVAHDGESVSIRLGPIGKIFISLSPEKAEELCDKLRATLQDIKSSSSATSVTNTQR